MKRLKKKKLAVIICAVLLISGLTAAAVILAVNFGGEGKMNGTVVNIDDKREIIADYIIEWDSSEKKHA